jgi:hypothetical protein
MRSKRGILFYNRSNLEDKKTNCLINNWKKKKTKITTSKNILKPKIMLLVTIALVLGLINFSSSSTTINNISAFHLNGQNVTSPLGPGSTFNTPADSFSAYDTYENANYGITIQFPPDWKIDENDYTPDDSIDTVVSFSSPLEGASDEWQESVSVSIENLPTVNNDLDTIVDENAELYDDTLENFEVVSVDTSGTLAGEPAYELIYTDTLIDEEENGDDIDLETWEIGTIIGNKLYFIEFTSEAAKFPNLLPVVGDMVSSFQIR